MKKVASWRGPANATKKREFTKLLKLLRPAKKDVFYDLGCGYGFPCIWISKKVKKAIGIENHLHIYQRAKSEIEKAGVNNVRILKNDISNASYSDATIIYTVIGLTFNDFARIQRLTKRGTKIILYDPPPYPLKSKWLTGNYFQMINPFEPVRNDDEYARIWIGTGKTMNSLEIILDRESTKRLKWEVSHAKSNLKILLNKNQVLKRRFKGYYKKQ